MVTITTITKKTATTTLKKKEWQAYKPISQCFPRKPALHLHL